MMNLIAAVFGAGVVVAMAAMAAGMVYVGMNEESTPHDAAAAQAAD